MKLTRTAMAAPHPRVSEGAPLWLCEQQHSVVMSRECELVAVLSIVEPGTVTARATWLENNGVMATGTLSLQHDLVGLPVAIHDLRLERRPCPLAQLGAQLV